MYLSPALLFVIYLRIMAELLLPNLLIAGVHKAATTSLFAYLVQHAEVCGATKKEIHHYTPLRYGGVTPSLQSYSEYFKSCCRENWRLEASPSYLYLSPKDIDRLVLELNAPKVIFILREPTARFISYYKHCLTKYLIDENTDFNDFCKNSFVELQNQLNDTPFSRSLREGNYSNHLQHWLKFGPDKVRLIYFETFIQDPKNTMKDLCVWLGINPEIYENYPFEIENKTVGSKSKFLFRIAQQVNNQLETFWRKKPGFKRFLRSIYYRLNGKKMVTSIDPDSKSSVEKYYYQEKKRLKDLLIEHGVSDLPQWLNNI